MRRLLLCWLFLVVGVRSVEAHANLIQANPAANTILDAAPSVITLTFTEPLEPQFSRIRLLDAAGNEVSTPPSAVDPANQFVMSLAPGSLDDGLYTVSWRAISAADGHQTSGSYAFAVGADAGMSALATLDTETVPPLSAAARWFDLISLSLLVGGIGFLVIIGAGGDAARPHALIRIGWGLAGVSAVGVLLVQAAQAADGGIAAWLASLPALLAATRFGGLWIARGIAWGVCGAAIWRRDRPNDGIALAAGAVILLTHSLYSHASAAYDLLPAVASDWLHLTATVLWVGGLAQFLNVVLPLLRDPARLAGLVRRFSNYARVCVAALVITGLYAAWLEVGSVAALTGTLYGRALLIKLILFAPLLAVAAVNLLVTTRCARGGSGSRLLRGLVSAEIALAVGIFAAVGVMASANPARSALALRQPPPDHTISQFVAADNMHVHFEVSPGWVGANTFYVTLYDMTGNPITDASLIRVRFDAQTQRVGQSEIRPVLTSADEGTYAISGTNLSVPGAWRARITVARPEKFDTVVDFNLTMQPAPTPPGLDMSAPLAGRQWALLIAGLALLALGGFAGGRGRFTPLRGVGLLATATILVGVVMIIGGVM